MEIEAPPDGRIEKVRMIGGSEQYTGRRPVIDLLNEHGHKTLELANLAAVSREQFGDSYCGGEIEKSMKRVINGG